MSTNHVDGDRVTWNSQWVWASVVLLGFEVAQGQQVPFAARYKPQPNGDWTADAIVDQASMVTDTRLGAGQDAAVRDDKVDAYGDVRSVSPRVGVIREDDLDLKPTGREVWLRKDGKPLILHPTGLTWGARYGTFLGDTVNKQATIYRLNWNRAWLDGNLDSAVLDTVKDGVSVNCCRPEFVIVDGKTLLTTTDYGDIRPEIRLIDPETLLKARRISAPGVVVNRVLTGPGNQNLHWDRDLRQLILRPKRHQRSRSATRRRGPGRGRGRWSGGRTRGLERA